METVPTLAILAARKVLNTYPQDILDILVTERLKTMHIPWVRKIGNIFDNIFGEDYYIDILKGFINTFPQFVYPVPEGTYKQTEYRRYFRRNGKKHYVSTENISDPITNDNIIAFFTRLGIHVACGIVIGV